MVISLHRIGGDRLGLAAVLSLALAAPLAAQSTWTSGGPLGGNVYAIAGDPANPATMYTGTQRGVFKSVDGGASWGPAGTGLPAARVQAIAIDPSSPSTVYVGTLTPTGLPSVGIFKSGDAGATWVDANVGLVDPVTGAGPLDVQSIAVDPKDPRVLLAGTYLSEIFRSADGGATWEAATFGGNSLQLETTAIVFDPSNPSNVYAASNAGFLLSTNNGESWAQAGNAGVPFFALAVDPTTPKTVYAGDSSGSGIWKSTDGGAHWSTMNVGLPGSSSARPAVIALAVDPAKPATIYAGTFGNGVFSSANGGGTWTAAAGGMRDTQIGSLLVAPGSVFAGTFGGGIYESLDGAQTWSASNAGLQAALVYSVVTDPATAGLLYAATSDGVVASADAGLTWKESDSGLPPVTVAALARVPGGSGRLLAGTLGDGMYRSSDGGATWTPSAQGLNDSSISSIVVDPTSPSTVYAGTAHPFTGSNSERLFKSADGGASWAQTSLDAGQFSVDFIAVNPVRGSQVVAGSAGASGLFESVDGGTTWTTGATDPVCGGLSAIAFDPSGVTMYAAGTTGVCRSVDGGKTWTLASAGGRSIASVLVDPATPSTIYAGAGPDPSGDSGGVFVSTDGGSTFLPLGDGLPPSPVDSLALDPGSGILYGGTFGAGVSRLLPDQEREPAVPPGSARRPTRTVPPRPSL